jgi:hypothetical protein
MRQNAVRSLKTGNELQKKQGNTYFQQAKA